MTRHDTQILDMTPLPKFEQPPVVETVLGVQFKPLKGFRNGHLGLFWSRLDHKEWPEVKDAATIDPQFETFVELPPELSGIQRLRLTQDPASRLQITNAGGDRMIQVQNGRFLLNWLGKKQERLYPSYDQVCPEFFRHFSEFKRFVAEEELDEIVPNQWEVTYVNHIPKDTVWAVPQDWATLFRLSGTHPEVPAELRLESFTAGLRYEIQPRKGRVHVRLQHGRLDPKSDDNQDVVVVLTLTARGPVKDGQLRKGLDTGHEAIVRLFTGLTSEAAHEYWSRVR